MTAPVPPLSVTSGPALSSTGETGGYSAFGDVVFNNKDSSPNYVAYAGLAVALLVGLYVWKTR